MPKIDIAAVPEWVRGLSQRYRQRPSPDQSIGRDSGLSGGGLAAARGCHHLLRHRHDEPQQRRPLPAQEWDALL